MKPTIYVLKQNQLYSMFASLKYNTQLIQVTQIVGLPMAVYGVAFRCQQ